MNKKPLCFIISPIGEAGSDTRRDADDLLELIIKPALEVFTFDIIRGDHRSEANQIDIDVIKSVQDAEVCIADVSLPNVNVYYEVGRRDETGKPLILLKSKSSPPLPVDIATRRYIEYDLDSRRGIGDARQQLRNFIQPIVDSQFEGRSGASLGEIAAILQRVERKLDRSIAAGTQPGAASTVISSLPGNADPKEAFELARKQRNIPLLEQCLDVLSVRVDRLKFIDYYVEVAAGIGSHKAGNLLIEHAEEFIDEPTMSFKKKVEFVSHLVSYANRSDREAELRELIEKICLRLEYNFDNAEAEDIASMYNAKNRLYHGLYVNTDDQHWLELAVTELNKARDYNPGARYIYYNLASCYYHLDGYIEDARECIDRVIEMDNSANEPDDDHLELACKIHRVLGSPKYSEYLEQLRAINPVKAALLESN